MIKAYSHQEKFATLCWDILKEKGYVYLAGKPRSGKTYTSILVAEKSDKISSVLVLTKKAAISGWHKFIDGNLALNHRYHVTNYEQVGSLKQVKNKWVYNLKLNPEDYDLVIIDESHNLGTLAKPSKRIRVIQKLCANMPHIHLSGTAIVESPNGIYHQMTISKYRPFPHKNFYDFFREYGVPHYIKAQGREIQQYDKAKDTLMPKINEFTVYMTQEHAGIDKSVQAVDKVHYVELEDSTKDLYNKLQEDMVIELEDEDGNTATIICDTVMRLRVVLHQIEGGIIKVGDNDEITYNMD